MEADMTTLTVYGLVVPPTKPDAYGVLGYDNGAFFGPFGTNLSNDLLTIVWTGSPDTGITGATLGINGVTIDLLAYHNAWDNEWRTDTVSNFIQLQTTGQYEPFPSLAPILPSSQYSVITNFGVDPLHYPPGGAFYLQDTIHDFTTAADFIIAKDVPGPIVGTGLSALIVAILIVLILKKGGRYDQIGSWRSH
jgi:hypothetical protein